MFQTGIHQALQSWGSDFLTQLMQWITSLGNSEVAMALILLVVFGFNLRKGFLLFQLIAWTALVGHMAKRFFGLPRPFFVDQGVQCLDPYFKGFTPLPGMAAPEFWSLPPDQVVEAYRQARLPFGFPSGHSYGAVSLWGGLALYLNSRTLKWLAPLMIFLLAFTRLYLGVHFLADVLGGLLLGGGMLYLAWRLWGRDWSVERLKIGGSPIRLLSPHMLYLFYLPLVLLFFRLISPSLTGHYLGANAAYLLAAWAGGLPVEKNAPGQRLLRVLLAAVLVVLGNLAAGGLVGLLPGLPIYVQKFLAPFLGTSVSFLGSFSLMKRIGLYGRE